MTTPRLAFDNTITLDINGSRQHLRLCAARPGLPPLLIVQGGPGLPLLHEVAKFQRLLDLESDFLVGYWEQRGCGNASPDDAHRASLTQQVDDLREVLRWLHAETGQPVLILGISWSATIALQAVEHEAERVTAVVAISPDLQTADNDAAAHAFLQELALGADRGVRRRVRKLGAPPYLDLQEFQRRTRLLMDLGTIERKHGFTGLLRELLVALIRTYGVVGAMKTLRNMNTIQRRLLPEMAGLDFFARPPRLAVPIHYVFGALDALTRVSAVTTLPAAITPPNSTVLRVPDAGHMVHFDQPQVVRSVLEKA